MSGDLNIDHRLETAADLARALITTSVVVPAQQPVRYVVLAGAGLRVGREIEALLRMRANLAEAKRLQDLAMAEMQRLNGVALVRFQRALMTLAVSMGLLVAAGVLLALSLGLSL